jgi:hypothetical protein
MVFVADDLAAWLIFILADAGRKKLTSLVLGDDQKRALRSAATAAVHHTAEEQYPDDAERAGQLAMVVSQVFGEPVPGAPLAGETTVLQVLQAGIVAQLAVLDDASLTGTGQSSAELLGVPGTVVAAKLAGHLLREIVVRGSRGGPLEPLANQLNHDVTHLQGQRLEGMLGPLVDEARGAFSRLNDRDHQACTPRLEARVTAHLAVTGRRRALPLYLLELRLFGPSDLDEVDVYIEDGRWLAFTGNQEHVTGPFYTGYGHGDISPEATLISLHAIRRLPLRVGGQPAAWQVQLANLPLTSGDQVPSLRVECRATGEAWSVAVPVKDAEIILDHPVIRMLLGPSWPKPRPIRWSDIIPGEADEQG